MMTKRIIKKLFVILTVFCLVFSMAMAETATVEPAVITESTGEAVEVKNETVETDETAAPDAEATAEAETVPDPDFANTSDPLATLRLILAAVGAFAIAFMYSRMQHSRSRARNKR